MLQEKSKFLRALATPPHASWQAFLSDPDVGDALLNAEAKVTESVDSVMPALPRILRFLTLNLAACKVIVIGQDPYPQIGAATGRCFEVGGLRSWSSPFRNISLKNIVRAIYRADTGTSLTYKEVLLEIANGWPLLPPGELFKDWERQGVLLLNTAFTVQVGNAGSHMDIWKPFSEKLLRFIAQENPDLVWFLWGNYAKRVASGLDIAHVYASQHPMMCYDKPGRDDDFLFGTHNMFQETAHLIRWQGEHCISLRAPQQQTLF